MFILNKNKLINGDIMFLTICTPTFNRAYTLERTYKSLLSQTNKNFEWIVVDDGSTDNTEQLVRTFINEKKIRVRYFKQPNQGKHIALNKGIDESEGELFTCLDSDDWLYNDAVENIYRIWERAGYREDIVGIISLDTFANGKIVGSSLPDDVESANWMDLKYKYKVTGDKDFYFRTSELKKVKFPNFNNNKHMPPGYQIWLLSKKYKFFIYNKPTKYVEYMEDGISKNKYNKYVVAPDNFAIYRYEIMNLIPNKKDKIINAIHFNASLFLGTIKLKPKKITDKVIVLLTKPIGYLLSIYIKSKVNKSHNVSHNVNKVK